MLGWRWDEGVCHIMPGLARGEGGRRVARMASALVMVVLAQLGESATSSLKMEAPEVSRDEPWLGEPR